MPQTHTRIQYRSLNKTDLKEHKHRSEAKDSRNDDGERKQSVGETIRDRKEIIMRREKRGAITFRKPTAAMIFLPFTRRKRAM